jgi:hypothetical protein
MGRVLHGAARTMSCLRAEVQASQLVSVRRRVSPKQEEVNVLGSAQDRLEPAPLERTHVAGPKIDGHP